MADPPASTILSVGTELTEGSILNTHFRFLGAEIKGLGFYTRRCVQIPDDPDIFLGELRRGAPGSGAEQRLGDDYRGFGTYQR